MGRDLQDSGVDRLREALKAMLRRRRLSMRKVERAAGLGHGTVGNMLSGRTHLQLRHLEAMARALGLTLEELLTQAYGLPSPEPRDRRDRLRALLTEVVRGELDAFWDRHGIRIEGRRTPARVEKIE